MTIFNNLTKTKKIILIVALAILIFTPSTYAGASYHQSNKLLNEATKLVQAGDYVGAIAKYDQANKKWKWNNRKIKPKKDLALKYKHQDDILKESESNFGKGEWQKCLDNTSAIEKDFPKYNQAQNRYSDCQKKLDEEVAAKKAAEEAAAKKAEEDRLAAEAATKKTTAAKPRTSISAQTSSAYPLPSTEWKTYTNEKFGFSLRYPTKMYQAYWQKNPPEYTGFNQDLSKFTFTGGVLVSMRAPENDGDYQGSSRKEIDRPANYNNLFDQVRIDVYDTSVPPTQYPFEEGPSAGKQETTEQVTMANGKTCTQTTSLGLAQKENESLSYLNNHFLPQAMESTCVTMIGKYRVEISYSIYQYPGSTLTQASKTPFYDYQNTWAHRNDQECKIDWRFQCSFNGYYWTDVQAFYRDLVANRTEPVTRMWRRNTLDIFKSINF